MGSSYDEKAPLSPRKVYDGARSPRGPKDLWSDKSNDYQMNLPSQKPPGSKDDECAMRLFIVMNGNPLFEDYQLQDIFSRFSGLIDCYRVKNKSIGYARYNSVASGKEAIDTLHQKTIQGVFLKVLEAEPPKEETTRKRPRV